MPPPAFMSTPRIQASPFPMAILFGAGVLVGICTYNAQIHLGLHLGILGLLGVASGVMGFRARMSGPSAALVALLPLLGMLLHQRFC